MKTKTTYSSVCIILAIATTSLGTGCASIVHGGNRSLSVGTEPTGARATISKSDGQIVSVTTTPCTVALDPRGGYFKGQSYLLKLELPGYQAAQIELRAKLSGWYWGNLIFGGLIGMLAVDPVTGSMWNIAPEEINQKLSSSQSALLRSGNGFVVVLASALNDQERAHMVKIN